MRIMFFRSAFVREITYRRIDWLMQRMISVSVFNDLCQCFLRFVSVYFMISVSVFLHTPYQITNWVLESN